ncbi:MAG: OsmC family protein [Xenococcus sp. (in: cyanobacteria)]
MSLNKNGGGKFIEVILTSKIAITVNSNLEKAKQLHHEAHELCFISNFVNFPVLYQALIHLQLPSELTH